MCKISIADGCHSLTVHSKVHLPTIALDSDIVPVEVVQQATHGQCNPAVHFVYDAASLERNDQGYVSFFFIVRKEFEEWTKSGCT